MFNFNHLSDAWLMYAVVQIRYSHSVSFAITDESRAVNETLAILMVAFEFSSAVLTTIWCLQAFHAAGSSWREQKGSLLYLIFEQGMHHDKNRNYLTLWSLLVRFAGIGILYFRWEEHFEVVMSFESSTFNISQYYFLFCYWYCYSQLRAFPMSYIKKETDSTDSSAPR